MDKSVIDYLSGELNWFSRLLFKYRAIRNPKIRKGLIDYKEIWDILGEWKEKAELPKIEIVKEVSSPFLMRLKPAYLMILGIIGLGIGFYIGFSSYISASDYVNYAVEVLYEE